MKNRNLEYSKTYNAFSILEGDSKAVLCRLQEVEKSVITDHGSNNNVKAASADGEVSLDDTPTTKNAISSTSFDDSRESIMTTINDVVHKAAGTCAISLHSFKCHCEPLVPANINCLTTVRRRENHCFLKYLIRLPKLI